MMHKLLIVCVWFFVFNSKTHAQNLVPNYSFENYTTCPTGSSQIGYATPWGDTFNNNIEYYNSCATPCFWSVPCQSSGSYQYARTGNAFIGFWFLNGYGGNYREYLQVELLDSLENGKCYQIKYYINLHNSIKYAINNFGLYLSNTYHTSNFNGEVLNMFVPQIMNFKNEIIDDTLNWVEISGIYTANGGEKYIIIGNFSNDANTDTLDTGNGTYPGAYYYIDDVSVIPIDSIPGGMPAYAGADTNVIVGDSVFIGQQISNLNCNWYNAIGSLIASGTSGIYVSPTVSTFYVVEQNLCGVITYDTVNVTVLPVSIYELQNKIEVRIYPNPSRGLININMMDMILDEINLTIEDISGKTIYTNTHFQLTGGMAQLKLKVENGIYFVRIRDNISGKATVKKIIINE